MKVMRFLCSQLKGNSSKTWAIRALALLAVFMLVHYINDHKQARPSRLGRHLEGLKEKHANKQRVGNSMADGHRIHRKKAKPVIEEVPDEPDEPEDDVDDMDDEETADADVDEDTVDSEDTSEDTKFQSMLAENSYDVAMYLAKKMEKSKGGKVRDLGDGDYEGTAMKYIKEKLINDKGFKEPSVRRHGEEEEEGDGSDQVVVHRSKKKRRGRMGDASSVVVTDDEKEALLGKPDFKMQRQVPKPDDANDIDTPRRSRDIPSKGRMQSIAVQKNKYPSAPSGESSDEVSAQRPKFGSSAVKRQTASRDEKKSSGGTTEEGSFESIDGDFRDWYQEQCDTGVIGDPKVLKKKSGRSFCECLPKELKGSLFMDSATPKLLSFAEIDRVNPSVDIGGYYQPHGCIPRQKVAIVIPYRDREKNLRVLLEHLHPILQRQQLEYQIFLAEQKVGDLFNKGLLMNAAFKEIDKSKYFNCIIFHDVDMLMETDLNMYTCPSLPRHVGSYLSKYGYKLFYKSLIGGVLSFRPSQFVQVNGFSNKFQGWGGEDDNMYKRLQSASLGIYRYPKEISKYQMIKHNGDVGNPQNGKRGLIMSQSSAKADGLNSVKYTVRSSEEALFTRLIITPEGSTCKNGKKLSLKPAMGRGKSKPIKEYNIVKERCLQMCNNMAECMAVSYSTKTLMCYIHSQIEEPLSASMAEYYTKTECIK